MRSLRECDEVTVKGESSSFVQRFCSDLAISGFSLDFMSLGVPLGLVGCDSNDFGEDIAKLSLQLPLAE